MSAAMLMLEGMQRLGPEVSQYGSKQRNGRELRWIVAEGLCHSTVASSEQPTPALDSQGAGKQQC